MDLHHERELTVHRALAAAAVLAAIVAIASAGSVCRRSAAGSMPGPGAEADGAITLRVSASEPAIDAADLPRSVAMISADALAQLRASKVEPGDGGSARASDNGQRQRAVLGAPRVGAADAEAVPVEPEQRGVGRVTGTAGSDGIADVERPVEGRRGREGVEVADGSVAAAFLFDPSADGAALTISKRDTVPTVVSLHGSSVARCLIDGRQAAEGAVYDVHDGMVIRASAKVGIHLRPLAPPQNGIIPPRGSG
jgi:hypothetical protein